MIDRPNTLLRRLLDDVQACFDDPWNDDGESWLPACATPQAAIPFSTEAELTALRNECRRLACENEFALCAIENRISYVVGSGHTYRVVPRDESVPDDVIRRAESVLERFLRENRWHRRQSEMQRRLDRDGEVFVRLFDTGDGLLRLRFVDPEQVSEPADRGSRASFGIECDSHDVETVLAYWIDGRRVPGACIQHRKANVDANVKRGLSLFYPVRKNLKRAEKLLRNMSVVAGIQSAVALIRKHARRDRAEVERFVAAQADPSGAPAATSVERFPPGTILDATAGIDYEFPVAAIDAGKYVTLLQAELRAIASRLVMPEYMLTSDAGNANYASTLVAEGPAVKMFARLQQAMIEDDLVLFDAAFQAAAAAGELPADFREAFTVQAHPPGLVVRDRLKEVQADALLVRLGAMSPETMAARAGVSRT
ncbi:hypothetical protein JCM19992_02670 [Thermostilla marina]